MKYIFFTLLFNKIRVNKQCIQDQLGNILFSIEIIIYSRPIYTLHT